jgi:hypothetical protein
MNTFNKKAMRLLLKPVAYTSLILAPLLYGCNEDTTQQDILAEEKQQTQYLKQLVEQDSIRPSFTKDDPGYVASYPMLPEVDGDSVRYAGQAYKADTVELKYISSEKFVRDVVLNIPGCGAKESIDDIIANNKRIADSLANSNAYVTTKLNTSKKSKSTYNKKNNQTSSVLDNIGEEVDVNAMATKEEPCIGCLTREQLLFNSRNEDYKTKNE